jgi:hypothetical protein
MNEEWNSKMRQIQYFSQKSPSLGLATNISHILMKVENFSSHCEMPLEQTSMKQPIWL